MKSVALFRKEVLEQRADRLTGDVSIAPPMSWQVIGYLIFGALVAALLFLSLASYARVETVTGQIMPDKGIAQIVPVRGGIVGEIHVSEGQMVEEGALLVSIRSEDDQEGGTTTAAQIAQAIAAQDASLAAQVDLATRSSAAQQAQLDAQKVGLRGEIAQLQSQVLLQEDMIATARRDYEAARDIAERGFISQRDLQTREDLVRTRQQQLLQLNQMLTARRAALIEAERTASQIAAQAGSQLALISANRAEVAQQAASTQGARSFVLRAPIAGQVTALTARTGQAVAAGTPLINIVPQGAKLRAELHVPSNAIGFVEPGQEVRLALDAFPYQRFGTVDGRVLSVSNSAINRQLANGGTVPVYIVTVDLAATDVLAFGDRQPLIPGMTLTARIVAEDQSLLEWLFEPLFAVRER